LMPLFIFARYCFFAFITYFIAPFSLFS
jgi:hypothetical protein